MISLQEVLTLHENSIRDYGGSFGLRSVDLLQSAIARPFQSFDGKEFYPTVYEKAAAILESIVKNHPFTDGNKRTGFLAAFAMLIRANIEINADNESVYNFVITIASSQLTFEEIVHWMRENSIQTA